MDSSSVLPTPLLISETSTKLISQFLRADFSTRGAMWALLGHIYPQHTEWCRWWTQMTVGHWLCEYTDRDREWCHRFSLAEYVNLLNIILNILVDFNHMFHWRCNNYRKLKYYEYLYEIIILFVCNSNICYAYTNVWKQQHKYTYIHTHTYIYIYIYIYI